MGEHHEEETEITYEAETTAEIILTDSPLPSRRASTLIEDVSSGPNTGDDMELASSDLDTTSNFDEEAMRSFCASLKCPICFDHFIVPREKESSYVRHFV